MLDDLQLKTLVESIETDVFKEYLRSFSDYHPQRIADFDLESWKENRIRNIKISKFVRNPDEPDVDNLCQLFQSFNGEDCTISMLFHHSTAGTDIYFRIADVRESVSSPGTINALSDRANRIFSSVFAGVDICEMPSDFDVLQKGKHIVSVTNLASKKEDAFVSIENLFNYHGKEEYSVLLIAEPISDRSRLDQETSSLCSYLSGISEYESQQISDNTATTKSKNYGIALAASAGFGIANVDGHSETKTVSNYSVKHMINQIDKSLERIDMCKALGGWKFASYVISNSLETAKSVAHQYDAVVRGKDSEGIFSAILGWEKDDSEAIHDYLVSNQHPIFVNGKKDSKDITATISSLDLAQAMNIPRKSLPGFPVTECAAFGRNVTTLDEQKSEKLIAIGKIEHMHHQENTPVELNPKELTAHVFITGSTGSGKSNTVYQLLNELTGNGKTFLVVEPTKGEYKEVFGGRKDVTVLGTNYKVSRLLRINPFSFPDGIQLYAHLDRLIEIFNACWPMYAAMPAVLKDAIERAYIDAGWDLATSENSYGRLFPTFIDVLRQIDIVMNESDYSGESKGDYKGALKTRLKSLTNGVYSQIFTCDECSEEELFNENVIIDLSEIGTETTSLIMGVLVLKLQEYRMASKAMNSDLKHITVLEEAHNLLKRTSTEQSAENSNLVGKSVEMITNAIAEMRTYGECFMIVDQAPGALDPAAIRNTNTKIVLRLPDQSDRELVGKAIGLNENQIVELSKLERGVAAVYQSGWIEAVLCKFERFTNEKPLKSVGYELKSDRTASVLMGTVLFGSQYSEIRSTLRNLRGKILKAPLPATIKRAVLDICNSQSGVTQTEIASVAYDLFDADQLFAGNKTPTEKDLAHQIFITRQKYQIIGRAMEQENLNQIFTLIEQERLRRESSWMVSNMMGGVL